MLWPRVSKAIGDAIDWMRDNYAVVRGDMIPYEAMLAVLACYFAEHGSNVPLDHKEWIDRWFWRSAFSERYSKSSNTQMANDAKSIKELIGGKLELPNYPLNYQQGISSENADKSFFWCRSQRGALPSLAGETKALCHWRRHLASQGPL
jgi:hypothetical protein